MLLAAPVPLPNKPQPTPNPVVDWVKRDLVQAELEYTPSGSHTSRRETRTFQAMGLAGTHNGLAKVGPTDARAFKQLPAASFVDAVEAASRLAAAHPINLNIARRDPSEKAASMAVGVLQSDAGAYYVTSFSVPYNQGSLSVDTGRTNFVVHDVQALHPDLKAVVGAHSWVDFTGSGVAPDLAG